MRLISWFLVLLTALSPLQALAQAPASAVVRLEEGTPIIVRPPYDVRSDMVKTGDVIDFVVSNPVVVNGVTLVEKGAKATITITEAKHASGFGQSGKLRISVNTVTAVDGTKIRLRGSPDQKGDDNTALSIAGAVLFSVFFVFLQGKEAVLKADKELTAYTDESKDFAVLAPSAPQASTQVQPVAVQTQPAVVAVQQQPAVAVVQQQPPVAVAQQQIQTPIQPSPAPGATDPGSSPQPVAYSLPGIEEHLLCKSVDRSGQPLKISTVYGANAFQIATWFKLAPDPAPRSFEVRWYASSTLVATTPLTVPGGEIRAWSSLKRKSIPLTRGDWRVELVQDGQTRSCRPFTVTF